MFEQFLDAARTQGALQWAAFVTGLAYVGLAARQSVWCWAWGIGSVVLYFFVFWKIKLYSDATLQVCYFFISIYGWQQWRSQSLLSLAPTRWHWKQTAVGVAVALALTLPLGAFWATMGGALPYADALLTSFSLLATWMTTKKIVQNWLFWIVINIGYIILYWNRQVELTAVLYVVYLVMSVVGWRAWRKKVA